MKNRDSPSRYASTRKSPSNARIAPPGPIGTSAAASSAVTSPITGPARNTQVVVRLNTESFRSSFTISWYGWSSGGPTRPPNIALVLLMTPSMIGGTATMHAACSSLRMMSQRSISIA